MPSWAALSLALATCGAACRPDVPILTWHSIGPGQDEFTVGEGAFAAQLDALQRAGYHSITFHDWLEHRDRGVGLPDKPILLTFDDGDEDAFTAALPALRARGMRATFFVVSGWIRPDEAHRFTRGETGRSSLIWPEVRALAAAGMEIGSHGRTHRRLSVLSSEEALQEMASSKRDLEAGLQRTVEVFAYPYNASRSHLRTLAQQAGYRAAVSGVDHGGADRYDLFRRGVGRGTSPEDLLRALR